MAWPAGYTLLPHLAGGTYATANGVSGDGNVVVGEADNPAAHAVYWTIGAAPVELGHLSGGTHAIAQGANSDGSVIVGYGDDSAGHDHAFRWTAAGIAALPVPVGSTASYAYGISGDGTTIVGEFDDAAGKQHACYWLNANNPVDISPSGASFASAAAVSNDGSVIVGVTDEPAAWFGRHAFRWTQAGGIADLGLLSGTSSEALAVSADGSVVAGVATDSLDNSVAFRWTQAGGMVAIGHLGTAGPSSFAFGCTGTVIVGRATDDTFNVVPFTWTAAAGMAALLPLPVGGDASGYDGLGIAANGSAMVGQAPVSGLGTAWVYGFASPPPFTGESTVVLLPSAELQFSDANGHPYAGGTLELLVPGTTTSKDTWVDPAGAALNTNPIVLDAAGRCIVYGDGAYRSILKDALGNLIWDRETTTEVSAAMMPVVGAATIEDAKLLLGIDDSGLPAEVAAREAADAAETAARIAADANLQSEIDAETAARIAADTALAAIGGPNVRAGSVTTNSSGYARITFATPFPTACAGIQVTPGGQHVAITYTAVTNLPDATGCDVYTATFSATALDTPVSTLVYYIAVGN